MPKEDKFLSRKQINESIILKTTNKLQNFYK